MLQRVPKFNMDACKGEDKRSKAIGSKPLYNVYNKMVDKPCKYIYESIKCHKIT